MEPANATELELAYTNAPLSWPAIIAGAVAAAALSLILLFLGAGLGLSSVSPWANKGVSASAFGISTIVWLTVTQILAAGMGGYLAGRLRTRWNRVDTDEVYFRDTAHGFLAWAVATLATAALLTYTIGGIVSGTTSLTDGAVNTLAATSAAASQSRHGNQANSLRDEFGYYVDYLFRKNSDTTSASLVTDDPSHGRIRASEVNRIFLNSIDAKTLPPADVTHIGQLISNSTGITQQDAEQRVNDIYSNLQKKKADIELTAKIAAEKARKATIYSTLWLFVSLLIGAFSGSLAATWGGRCRDADFVSESNPH